jgi:hypothetical protein
MPCFLYDTFPDGYPDAVLKKACCFWQSGGWCDTAGLRQVIFGRFVVSHIAPNTTARSETRVASILKQVLHLLRRAV